MSTIGSTKASFTIPKLKSFFSCHGSPEEVISDNGPPFLSADFANFAKEWDFKHNPSRPKYPQSNGLVERTVQTIKSLLDKAKSDKQCPYLAILEHRNTPTIVTEHHTALRSYIVKTEDGAEYRRNRKHLQATQETRVPISTDHDTAESTPERPAEPPEPPEQNSLDSGKLYTRSRKP